MSFKVLYLALSASGLVCMGAILSFVCLLLDIDQFRSDFLKNSEEYKVRAVSIWTQSTERFLVNVFFFGLQALSTRVWGEIVTEVKKTDRLRRSSECECCDLLRVHVRCSFALIPLHNFTLMQQSLRNSQVVTTLSVDLLQYKWQCLTRCLALARFARASMSLTYRKQSCTT